MSMGTLITPEIYKRYSNSIEVGQTRPDLSTARFIAKHRKMAQAKRQFDLELVSDWFSRCLKGDKDVLIDEYIEGYHELSRCV